MGTENKLRTQYDQSTGILSHSFNAQQCANKCSSRVDWILGQHKKPFTDGRAVKDCLHAVAETLLEGKQIEKNQANTYVSINSYKEN